MIFRIVFFYTVLRGILDALMGRPDLHERLARVMIARQVRAMLPVMHQLSKEFQRTGTAFLHYAKSRGGIR